MTTCSIDGCEKPSRARGWCMMHYRRWDKHGDPTPPELRVKAPNGALMAWVTQAVESQTDECLLWPYGVHRGGYGHVNYKGKHVGAHRLVLMLATDDDGEGLEAAHAPGICHNPLCCNPRHLRWATRSENDRDRTIDDTHRRGERNNFAKLTEADVLAIRADNRTQDAIAAAYGVGRSAVSDIKRRRNWAWLEQDLTSTSITNEEPTA